MSRIKGDAAAIKEIATRPGLQAKFTAALRIANSASSAGVRQYIEIGKIAVEVQSNPKRIYGDGAVDLLGKALGQHRSTFRRAMQIVKVFSAKELDSFLDRTSEAGHQITAAHLRLILPVPSAEMRSKLIELFYKKSLGVRELAKKAIAMMGGAPAVPKIKNVSGIAMQLKSMTRTMRVKLEEDLDETLFTRFRDLASGKIDASPDDVDLIVSVRESLESLKDCIEAVIEDVRKSESEIEERIGAVA